jgi:hypothetical protein
MADKDNDYCISGNFVELLNSGNSQVVSDIPFPRSFKALLLNPRRAAREQNHEHAVADNATAALRRVQTTCH